MGGDRAGPTPRAWTVESLPWSTNPKSHFDVGMEVSSKGPKNPPISALPELHP